MTISDLLQGAEELFARIAPSVNEVVIALVILLFGFVIGKIVESLLRYVFSRANVDERLAKMFKAQRNYARAIRRTIVRLIYLITVLLALQSVNLLGPVWVVLLALGVLVVLVSVVLAGLEVVPNIMGRAAILNKRLRVGDEILLYDQTGAIQGTIVDMTWSDVRIKRKNGDLFLIPNATFLRERVVKQRH
jgi:small-conductance mechanosensitive channel